MLTHTGNVKRIEALFMEVLGSYECTSAIII